MALTLSGLASHVCYFWAAHQRELSEVAAQLKEARARLQQKEESLSRGMRRRARHGRKRDTFCYCVCNAVHIS